MNTAWLRVKSNKILQLNCLATTRRLLQDYFKVVVPRIATLFTKTQGAHNKIHLFLIEQSCCDEWNSSLLSATTFLKWNLRVEWLLAAGVCPSFCAMKPLEVFLLPLDEMLVYRRVTPPQFVWVFPQPFAGTQGVIIWATMTLNLFRCLLRDKLHDFFCSYYHIP